VRIALLLGGTNANLVFGCHDKALLPGLNVFRLKEASDPPHERIATGVPQAHEEKAMVGAWHEPANVRKVQILRDEKATGCLGRVPDVSVILSCQPLLWNGIDLMTK
jgi:hypothetical protein